MSHPAAAQWMQAFAWSTLEQASPEQPLRVLSSACLVGHRVGWDDRPYPSQHAHQLAAHPRVQLVPFCPEHLILGTPRALTTIHHGNGFDVLDGRARVMDTTGRDHTERFVYAAEQMLEKAREHAVHMAILMEISDSCGSTAIYLGEPAQKVYQRGPGVSAAMLIRHGIPVVGSRDYRCLGALLAALNRVEPPSDPGINFDEDPWYLEYFKDTRNGPSPG